MKLLIATRNPHKLEEIRAILCIPSLELVDMDAFPSVPEVEENGETFEANAVKKAATVARASGMWALADDSGLEVQALDGEPGVRSARYAGEPVNYEANNSKLLAALDGRADRAARFRCVIALSDPTGACQVVEGRCAGRIVESRRGLNGFGYDPLFAPDGHDMTFAEMTGDVKNSMSHRSSALKKARERWGGLLAGATAPAGLQGDGSA